MRTIVLFLLVLSVALQDGLIAHAQDQPASIMSKRGQITNKRWSKSWTFTGNAGDVIEITMRSISGNLDTYLILKDETGNILAEDDDAGGNTDASFIHFLPSTGDYTIEATRFKGSRGNTSGRYELTVTLLAHESSSETSDGNSAGAGSAGTGDSDGNSAGAGSAGTGDSDGTSNPEIFTGEITNEQWWQYAQFNATQGRTIQLVMQATSGDLDCYLILRDEMGNILVEANDIDGNGNAIISNFPLPSSGVYTVIAGRYGLDTGTTSGTYQLTIMSFQ